MLRSRLCRICNATAPGRAIPVLLPRHLLEDWHLCGAGWGHLERGFAYARPGAALAPLLDGRGVRLTDRDLRDHVATGVAISHTARLSPEARRALALAAAGLTTDEVSARLGVGPDAVREHLRHAMRVLGARSKLEAVVLALRSRAIDVPGPPPSPDGSGD